ncbi:hypothetical protein [Deinococcus alpinitundrae]|uniref:hypothetical protein n=1 Tax=Deinococcus alpinitundrae TaxID=468913 RepID=UPI001379BEE6|nr:hypothetical protein [Deinococcus alpinitundrae]
MNRPLMNTVLIISLSFAAGSLPLAAPAVLPDSVLVMAPVPSADVSSSLMPTQGFTAQLSSTLVGAVKRILHNPPTY